MFYEIPEELNTIYLAGENEPFITTEFPMRLRCATENKLILRAEADDYAYYFVDTTSDNTVMTRICDDLGEFLYADEEYLYFLYYDDNNDLDVLWIGYDGSLKN